MVGGKKMCCYRVGEGFIGQGEGLKVGQGFYFHQARINVRDGERERHYIRLDPELICKPSIHGFQINCETNPDPHSHKVPLGDLWDNLVGRGTSRTRFSH